MDWSVSGVVFYGSLVMSALIMAADQALKQATDLGQKMDQLFTNPAWGYIRYAPLLLLIVAGVTALRRARVQEEQKNRTEESRGIVPSLGLTVDKSWLEPASEWTYKLKLRVVLVNEGDYVHIGKPRWVRGGIGIQGKDLGYRFQLVEGGKETTEIDVRAGQQCRLWIGLDPQGDIEAAKKLLGGRRLGVLVLPVTAAEKEVDLMVRL